MLNNLFDERKAAEAAAFFLYKAQEPLTILKLMKLLYLAERTSFAKYGEPMIGDRLVSMTHGPVLSMTYSHMNGERRSTANGWDHWIADRAHHLLSLRKSVHLTDPRGELLELSEGDFEVLDEVWEKFGQFDQWKLVDYTHSKCPEWKDPKGSMIPMDISELLTAVGYNVEQTAYLISEMRTRSELNSAWTTP